MLNKDPGSERNVCRIKLDINHVFECPFLNGVGGQDEVGIGSKNVHFCPRLE